MPVLGKGSPTKDWYYDHTSNTVIHGRSKALRIAREKGHAITWIKHPVRFLRLHPDATGIDDLRTKYAGGQP